MGYCFCCFISHMYKCPQNHVKEKHIVLKDILYKDTCVKNILKPVCTDILETSLLFVGMRNILKIRKIFNGTIRFPSKGLGVTKKIQNLLKLNEEHQYLTWY